MSDGSVLTQIERLVDEEHTLRMREQRDRNDGDALAADRSRLGEVGIELDRCWDLLRRRRARRNAGQDPDQAGVREAETVERYRG